MHYRGERERHCDCSAVLHLSSKWVLHSSLYRAKVRQHHLEENSVAAKGILIKKMAGMLPGVELARRRRTNHHQFEFTSRKPTTVHHHHQLAEPSSSMDETALMARKRLEQKLRRFSSAPSRWSKESLKGDKSFNPVAYVKETHSSKRQGKQFLQLDRRNSQREVCSICLENFQVQQQVMNLPCCHRYHSECLLPWLSAHSHCPYCRTNVKSSAN